MFVPTTFAYGEEVQVDRGEKAPQTQGVQVVVRVIRIKIATPKVE